MNKLDGIYKGDVGDMVFPDIYLNIFMFLWGCLIFIFNDLYNAMPLILFFVSLFLISRNKIVFSNKNLLYLNLSFSIYLIPIVISIILGYSRLSYLDWPSRFLLFVPIGYFLSTYSFKKENLLSGFLTGSFIIMSGLLWKWFHGDTRPMYWAHWNILSEVSVGVFCYCFIFYDKQSSRVSKCLAVACQLVSLVIVLVSGSRGSLLSLLVIVIAFFTIHYYLFRRKKVIAFFLVTVLVALSLTAVFSDSMKNRIVEGYSNAMAYASGEHQQTSVGYRFELWKASFIMIKEKPLFGYGNVGAYERLQELIKEGRVLSFIKDRQHHHSDYIETLVTRGIFGLFTLLLIYFVPLVLFFKSLKSSPFLSTSAILFVLSYMVCGIAEVPLRNGFSLIFYFMMTTIFVAQIYRSEAASS
ncbi:O-antigen ligase family protein [Geopsychrobacter electrodiphilus]|uniref:O-antigen ligase family protein n=1 Tax=Geopsychrobacter electrodiphilus TaxID=225196 RepID=UPI00036315D9|nr:O-antigen ligase family protein [Geopsychrobacter electrodiphilus]